MVEIEFIKENSIFIRSGSCARCGKCCRAYDKHPQDGGKRVPCKDMTYEEYDDVGIATCIRHEEKRPQICVDNPIYPYACMSPNALATCGYSWVVDDKLTKTEALEKFNKLCDECWRKDSCEFYDEVINSIDTKCIE